MSNPLTSRLRRQLPRAERKPEPPRVPFPPAGASWVGGPGEPAQDGVKITQYPAEPEAAAEPDPFAAPAKAAPDVSDAVKAGNDALVQLHAQRRSPA